MAVLWTFSDESSTGGCSSGQNAGPHPLSACGLAADGDALEPPHPSLPFTPSRAAIV